MPRTFSTLADVIAHGADALIDVRSPAEFAEDHIPGAINLPALSNDERAEVGTIYKQVSPFKARKVGAALVARNVATHLQGPLAEMDGSWKPIVYCWRGGQRSGSFASILQQIGWRADTINGGYQSYRRLVSAMLHDDPLPNQHIILIDGNTGTGKTDLLHGLHLRGVQTVDLEGIANHRGSLLGAHPDGQPAQKGFESRLANALTACDPKRPVVMEAESSKIGKLSLPPSLWAAMCAAPRIMISAPLAARASYLAAAYSDIAADMAALKARLAPLRRIRGHDVVSRWEDLIATGQHTAFAASLMADHYDPSYAKSRAAHDFDLLGTVSTETLDEDGLNAAVDQLVKLMTPG